MPNTAKPQKPKTPKAPNPPSTKKTSIRGLMTQIPDYRTLVKSIEQLGNVSGKDALPFAPKHSPLKNCREIIASLIEDRPISSYELNRTQLFDPAKGNRDVFHPEASPSDAPREATPGPKNPMVQRIRDANMPQPVAGALTFKHPKPPKSAIKSSIDDVISNIMEDAISQDIAGGRAKPEKNSGAEPIDGYDFTKDNDAIVKQVADDNAAKAAKRNNSKTESTFEKDLHHGRINPAFARFHTAKGLVKLSGRFFRSAINQPKNVADWKNMSGEIAREKEAMGHGPTKKNTRELGAMAAHFALMAADPNKVNEATMNNPKASILERLNKSRNSNTNPVRRDWAYVNHLERKINSLNAGKSMPRERGAEWNDLESGGWGDSLELKLKASNNALARPRHGESLEAIVGNFLNEKREKGAKADYAKAWLKLGLTPNDVAKKASEKEWELGQRTGWQTMVTRMSGERALGDLAHDADKESRTNMYRQNKQKLVDLDRDSAKKAYGYGEAINALVTNLLKESPDTDFSEDVTTGMIASIPMPMGQDTSNLCPCGSGKPKDQCNCTHQATPMQSALARIVGEPSNKSLPMNPRTKRMIGVWAGL